MRASRSSAIVLMPVRNSSNSHLGLDLGARFLYPNAQKDAVAAEQLNRTGITQPALFSLEYSLAQWWIAHGVRPQAMVGHSIGEYVAACLADVLSLEDAIAVTAIRGRLMQDCEPGSMLAVGLSQEELTLSGDIALAACNAPDQCVISGSTVAVAAMEESLAKRGVFCRKLQTSHAFHSSMMDPILGAFIAQMRRVTLRPPQIPYLSNLTGTWITAAEATDPEYWARHLRNTVRFSDCVNELLRQPERVMLEVGPGQTLASLVRQHLGKNATRNRTRVFASLRRREEAVHDSVVLLNALGQLWINGQAVNWAALHTGETVTRIPLPTYPFEHRRFWIDPDKKDSSGNGEGLLPSLASGTAIDARRVKDVEPESTGSESAGLESMDGWFYQRHWSRAERPAAASPAPSCWVVLLDSNGLGTQISLQLRGPVMTSSKSVPAAATNELAAGNM